VNSDRRKRIWEREQREQNIERQMVGRDLGKYRAERAKLRDLWIC
jgi:hypothetical protein